MKVTIEIQCDNAAFFDTEGVPEQGTEVGRILRELSLQLTGGELTHHDDCSLRDSNDNKVGQMVVSDE